MIDKEKFENSPEGFCPILYFPKKQSEPVLSHSEISGLIYVYFGGEKYEITKYAIEAVEAIKALEQEPRKGHWKDIPGYKDIAWCCSECEHFTTMKHNFCPNCGTRMKEV